MKKYQALLVLQQVARKNGVPLAEVIQEIDLVISFAMQSENPAIRAKWAQIPCVGSVPTAIEVVAFLSQQISDQA